MRFEGRDIDPIALWDAYVEFPGNLHIDGKFLPLVKCPNPAHDTNKKHFQINIQEGLVHCFAQCGISGTYAKAISLIEGCSEREARKIILGNARKGGNTDKRPKNLQRSEARRNIEIPPYDSYLPPVALDYLTERGITENAVAAWELGWDSDEKRIVIPAKDQRRITRFLIKRSVSPHRYPKYLYAPEGVSKNSLLFATLHIRPRADRLVVVEGSLDAIKLHQYGIPAVATLGTGISEKQLKTLMQLRPRKVMLMLDRDIAGIHGIEIAQRRLAKYPLYVCRYPKEKFDPAELTQDEAFHSIERALPISKWRQLAY